MAQGKKMQPAEIKKIQKAAIKHTTVDEDGNIDVNTNAVAIECGTNHTTVKKYTEDDNNFRKLLQNSIEEGYAVLARCINRPVNLANRRCEVLEGNEDLATASEIKTLESVMSDHAKMLQMLSGNPTEIVGGQIEIKKFDEW